MTFEAALAYIHSRPRFSEKPTLNRITQLLARLGDPQRQGRYIHVAGTNGKGSVCALTASVLQRAGYRTGLFTSPYLVDFRERFQINGALIAPEALAALTEEVAAAEAAAGLSVNEFEFVTAMGFLYFARMHCDYVVLETGLGGRWDATNVVERPACCCVVSISLDHMAILGNTIPEIAREKAGILKKGCPAVTPASQNPEALAVLRAALPELELAPPYSGELSLLGDYQRENAGCAAAICRRLGIPEAAIAAGIAAARWPGRLDLISRDPMILVDAGHNIDGIRALCQALDTTFSQRKKVVVMAMMRDKAHGACIAELARRAERFYACALDLPRALEAETVAAEARRCCGSVVCCETPEAAFAAAKNGLTEDSMAVICGSVYLAGAALQYF